MPGYQKRDVKCRHDYSVDDCVNLIAWFVLDPLNKDLKEKKIDAFLGIVKMMHSEEFFNEVVRKYMDKFYGNS